MVKKEPKTIDKPIENKEKTDYLKYIIKKFENLRNDQKTNNDKIDDE